MKKKSQIRKYSVEKVNELTRSQTIPQMLKMYAEHVQEKKEKLQQKKQTLINDLGYIRKQSQKTAFNMVDGIKDRIEKTSKIVMTAQSRPTADDIKDLTQLYTYMQHQTSLIHKNSTQTKHLHNLIKRIDRDTTHQSADYTDLDNKFATLQAECAKQEIQRDRLLAERDTNRKLYENMSNTIAEFRVKYDIVEGKIAEREKYLDHLVSYFNTRQNQDREKIQHQLEMANQLEEELLKNQEVYNQTNQKNMELEIRENEYTSRKSAEL